MNELVKKYEELKDEMHELIEEENKALGMFTDEGLTFEQALKERPSFAELHKSRKEAERIFYAFEKENYEELIKHY